MKNYQIPKRLSVGPNQNKRRREEKGELTVGFGGGRLGESTFLPFGLDALWLLVGTVASFGESFTFQIKVGTGSGGLYGGFADGQFCLFSLGDDCLEMLTRSKINPIGSQEIVLEDQRHQLEFSIPAAAMMSFEEMVEVGNAVLLSSHEYVITRAYEFLDNWDGGVYREPTERSDKPASP